MALQGYEMVRGEVKSPAEGSCCLSPISEHGVCIRVSPESPLGRGRARSTITQRPECTGGDSAPHFSLQDDHVSSPHPSVSHLL